MGNTTTVRVQQHWGTRLGVILAVTGSAVGLGNFLRFPGVAAANGGGAFMIPYLVAFVLIGLPLVWVEWSLGRFGGRRGFNSAAGIYRVACGRRSYGAYVGGLAAMVPVGIYMYYIQLEAWCLAFAWKYWSGAMSAMASSEGTAAVTGHIWSFSGSEADGAVFSAGWSGPLPWMVLCFVVNFVLIYRGLNRGIEFFCRWAMPALTICAFIVLARVLTLPAYEGRSVLDGLGFMWNPVGHVPSSDGAGVAQIGFWQALIRPQTWLAASGQIFFSLSVGMGVLTTYASYLRRRDDVALSGTAAAAGNGFCEVCLGGLIVIPSAIIFLGAEGVVGKGTLSLGFAALPGVFAHMPAGAFFGGLFFFLLFLAAVTSSLSMLQPAIALFEEGLGLGRRAAVAVLGIITALGAGCLAYLSEGLLGLDHADFWLANFMLFILAIFEVLLFGWVLGIRRGMAELRENALMPVPCWIDRLIQVVTPVLLIGIFGFWLYVNRNEGYFTMIADNLGVQIVLGILAILIAFFMLVVSQAVSRWRREEADGTRSLDVDSGELP